MHQHGSKYFTGRHTPTLRLVSKGQNSTFLEHGHVAYQIKWNHECSKMVANVFYQIRREWSIEHHASTYSVITHPRPLGWGQRSKLFFLNVVMLTFNLWAGLKGINNSWSCYISN